MEQKIKQDEILIGENIHIGQNIRHIRKQKGIGQTELVTLVQLENADVELTRETLVKIEREIQHIQASQLRAIKNVLETTYDELFK